MYLPSLLEKGVLVLLNLLFWAIKKGVFVRRVLMFGFERHKVLLVSGLVASTLGLSACSSWFESTGSYDVTEETFVVIEERDGLPPAPLLIPRGAPIPEQAFDAPMGGGAWVERAPYNAMPARYGNSAEDIASSMPADDADFMKKLQKIVKKYDFAQYNGIDRETHGLPDDFGVSFSVEYASGEKIYASDNQNVFMPLKLTEELAALFMCYAPSYYHYVSIPVEAAVSMMETEEDYLIVDVRRQDEYEAGHIPGAINVPNESIQEWDESVEAALPDRDRLLFIYCRTGRRSKQAAYVLFDSGYTRVYEFGGINDWPGEIEND